MGECTGQEKTAAVATVHLSAGVTPEGLAEETVSDSVNDPYEMLSNALARTDEARAEDWTKQDTLEGNRLPPTDEARAAIEKLRRLRPEDGWDDKFYAALEALELVVTGQFVAQGTPPHIVMARLIEDVAWNR